MPRFYKVQSSEFKVQMNKAVRHSAHTLFALCTLKNGAMPRFCYIPVFAKRAGIVATHFSPSIAGLFKS